MKKFTHKLVLKAQIIKEFLHTLWTYKLWWSIPVIFILLFLMMIVLVAGNTGAAAFIYPLF